MLGLTSPAAAQQHVVQTIQLEHDARFWRYVPDPRAQQSFNCIIQEERP